MMTPAALVMVLSTVVVSGQIVVQAAVSEPRTDPVRDPARRAVFVVGDSTVKNHGPGEGWGDYLTPYFDGRRIQVLNWAMGGRSSRSFIEEGRWQRVLAQLQPDDFVLIQFGHNDQRELTTDRGTIPEIGEASQEVLNETTKRLDNRTGRSDGSSRQYST